MAPTSSLRAILCSLLEHPTVPWIILFATSFLVLFGQANHSGLRGDSIYYAALARRIADSGEYLTLKSGPELNHHGPLVFWLTALAIKIFGPTPLGATLVSRLSGFGCIVLTACLGSRLLGKNVGWIAAIALTTSYVFFRNAVYLRLETTLMFGILLSLLGYFWGERSWGPAVFYSGIAVAVLAKSVAGLLPLGLAPFHALLAGRLHLPWKKESIRWVRWSFLLLVPLAWWAYLLMQYGMEPVSVYVTDFFVERRDEASRLQQFFAVYVSDFGFRYWPWLPFALLGVWTLCREASNKNKNVEQRANAGFIIGWVAATLFTATLKPAQYGRYLLPAYPAISMMTGAGVNHILKGRLPPWIPGFVGIATLIGAFSLACFPTDGAEKQNLSVLAAVLDRRLPQAVPVPFVTMLVDTNGKPKVSWVDDTRFQFFLGRSARPTTVAAITDAATRGRVTFITAAATYRKFSDTLKPNTLLDVENYIVAEVGSGQEILLP